MRVLAVAVLSLAACATPYGYTFRLGGPGVQPAAQPGQRDVFEDADVRAAILVDPAGADAILLDLTNKTDQVLQVHWDQVAMTRADGAVTTPRPDSDLGWIQPGAVQSTRLIPFALPRTGDKAAAYQGQRYELTVPIVVRREAKVYRFAFTVDVHAL